MGTKKGQRRKTARRAYEPRRPQKSKNGRRKPHVSKAPVRAFLRENKQLHPTIFKKKLDELLEGFRS